MGIVRIIKKFNLILSQHQKVRIFQLGVLMVIGGFLETCSVSLMLPFMSIVMDSDNAMDKWYIRLLCNVFHLNSSRTFLMVVATFLAFLYVFKNMFLMLEYNIQYRFAYGNMFELQKRLLAVFMSRPYEYFLKVNSGEMVRIVNNDINSAFNLLVTLLMLFTEMIVAGMLIMTIFVIMPVATIWIAVLLAILLVFIYVAIKPSLRRAGVNQQKSSAEMNKWLLQVIQGIKEIKVMQKERFFQDNYDKNGNIYVQSVRWSRTLSIAPRFIIEGTCMGMMFLIVAIMIYRGQNLEVIIPTLTAVAMAAIRLLPSVNRISNALTEVAYGEPMLDKVIENLCILDDLHRGDSPRKDEKTNAGKLEVVCLNHKVTVSEVTYHYPDSNENVLSGAEMTIRKGESIGIVGKSGSGKSTTVDIILGLLNPQKGKVFVDDADINANIEDWLNQIGYIPQTIFMLDDTIRANVAFGIPNNRISEKKVWQALEKAALSEFVQKLPDGLETQIGERGVRLSGGQRQRIGIARALYQNPEILIFDEATSALDKDTEAEILESIQGLQGEKTMIIIAHRLTTIVQCDRIYRVEDGKIVLERKDTIYS